jgi:hypothetical protein
VLLLIEEIALDLV